MTQPIACDMSTARDTPAERLAEYAELFDRALLRRDRTADALVFTFRADTGVAEQVDDLARREQACCPFMDYRVEVAGGEVVYTVTNPLTGEQRASVDVALDAMHDLPEHAASGFEGLLDRLEERGLIHLRLAG